MDYEKMAEELTARIYHLVWNGGNDYWVELKKETVHNGDCTNECHTCQVCFKEKALDFGNKHRELIATALLQVRKDTIEECAKCANEQLGDGKGYHIAKAIRRLGEEK